MCCQCRRSLSKGCPCFFSRPCGRKKRAFVRLLPLPPLFRQHRPPHFVYCVYPEACCKQKAWRSAHCTTQSHLLWLFPWLSSQKRVAVSPYTICVEYAGGPFFLPKLGHFFHAKQARMAQEKNLPGRRRVSSCTR